MSSLWQETYPGCVKSTDTMQSGSTSFTGLFVMRLKQIVADYQIDADEFAEIIEVDPNIFGKLLALEPVEVEFVLRVIDQLHHKTKLSFEWFLTYDLDVIPDLWSRLSRMKYNRDVRSERINDRRKTVQWMLQGLVEELESGIADPDSREVYSSNWIHGKIE